MTERPGSPVVLLIVTSMLFAAVWQCDQTGCAASRRRNDLVAQTPRPNRPHAPQRRSPKAASRAGIGSATAAHARRQQTEGLSTAAAAAEARSADVWTIALPAGIAPGLYRVVSSDGDVRWLRIVGDDGSRLAAHAPSTGSSAGTGAASAPEVYRSRSGAVRWYFIRIDTTRDTVASGKADRR